MKLIVLFVQFQSQWRAILTIIETNVDTVTITSGDCVSMMY